MSIELSMIVAVSKNRVIGDGQTMPWHLPADLSYFKKMTLNKIVFMGRRTFESIGKPLPNRMNVVISRSKREHLYPDGQQNELQVCGSIADGLKLCEQLVGGGADSEVMVIGGGQLYRQLLPYVRHLYLTQVDVMAEGAITFPELEDDQWERVRAEHRPADDRNAYDCIFETYYRQAKERPYRELINGESNHVQTLV